MSPLEAKARAWLQRSADDLPFEQEVPSLAALLSAVRREALEEAAKVCDGHARYRQAALDAAVAAWFISMHDGGRMTAKDCAEDIRSLLKENR
jgi:hypothetical protein